MKGRISCFFGILGVLGLVFAGGPSLAWGAYDAKGNRDPFIPLLSPEGIRIYPPGMGEGKIEGPSAGLTLNGILFEPPGQESLAIINDQVLQENDEFDGVRVLKIGRNSVTVLVDGEMQELVLYQPKQEKTQP